MTTTIVGKAKCVFLQPQTLLFNTFIFFISMEEKFYFCDSCGNLLVTAIDNGVEPYCCGEEMTLLVPNATDGNLDKHVPVVTYTSKHSMKVKIGEMPHPMTSEHNIRFVCLVTNVGFILRYLEEGSAPEVCICFNGKPVAIYAYCNIHGLWRADAPEIPSECNDKACETM